MKQTFVIGDIHGALKALRQLMGLMRPAIGDRLIFLGDYVDGWSESAGVIEYLMKLDTQYDCIFIKGNHDAWCADWLNGRDPDRTWLFHGGQSTVDSYAKLDDRKLEQHGNFFNRLTNYFVDDQNRLFIHAGFSSMHGPDHEHYQSNYGWDRTLWEVALATNNNPDQDPRVYPRRLRLFKEIYIGHTPTLYYDELEPMHACNVWNLDTGAAFYGRLSCMNIDTEEIWQTDVVKTMYPGERGRNKD